MKYVVLLVSVFASSLVMAQQSTKTDVETLQKLLASNPKKETGISEDTAFLRKHATAIELFANRTRAEKEAIALEIGRQEFTALTAYEDAHFILTGNGRVGCGFSRPASNLLGIAEASLNSDKEAVEKQMAEILDLDEQIVESLARTKWDNAGTTRVKDVLAHEQKRAENPNDKHAATYAAQRLLVIGREEALADLRKEHPSTSAIVLGRRIYGGSGYGYGYGSGLGSYQGPGQAGY